MEKMSVEQLKLKAAEIRVLSLEMIDNAGGGHIGGSLSAMDIMTALYFRVMNIDPKNPEKPDRDWFILSAGHKAAGYVPVLAARGFFDTQLLNSFNQLGSPFGMHPDMHKIVGCEASTGSLGHGLPIGVGVALSLRMDGIPSKVFCLMGDGETHEGTVWEAAMGAAHHKLDNLVAIVDYNKCSMDGPIDQVISLEPIEDKWRSFGWRVIRINGNEMTEVVEALERACEPGSEGKPTVIIADTLKGKGCEDIEGDYHWHYGVLGEERLGKTVSRLKGE